jgi:poly-gamma-glutamate synthesis protein (capsule biosynthesis protein)
LILGTIKFIILILLLTLSGMQKVNRFEDGSSLGDGQEDELSLLFFGDIMQHIPQIESAYDKTSGNYQYDSCFRYISGLISSADIAIGNLEVTLAGKPYSGYPTFSAPDSLIPALVRAGTDLLVTANNHSCDKGLKGILRTIHVLDTLGMPHTGTFRDASDRDTLHPLILEKKGIILALLNYTYGTNGIHVPAPAVVDLIDTSQIRKDYLKARSKGVDEVIIFFHWGEEYRREPVAAQKELAAFCHRLGIRVVIGSHPHVIEPMEAVTDSLGNILTVTVWSLGNFISNQRDRYRNGGALFGLNLKREADSIQIKHPGYHLAWVYTPFQNGKVRYQVLPVKTFENDSLFLARSDLLKIREFAEDSRLLLHANNVNVPEIGSNQPQPSGCGINGKNDIPQNGLKPTF